MADRLIRNWWALAARGAAALVFALLTLAWPELTVGAFVGLFAAFALADGVLTLITAARYRTRARDVAGPRDLLLVQGIVGTAFGLVAVVWPDATMAALLAIVGAWALGTGVPELWLALRHRRRFPGAVLLAGAGAAHATLGLVLLGAVVAGVVRVGWEIGAALGAAGVLRLLLAARAWRAGGVVVRPAARAGDAKSDRQETRSEAAA